jgi:hypothetical protein
MALAKAVAWRAPRVIVVNALTNAAILTTPNVAAFIADGDYAVESVSEIHETAGTDGGAVTADIVKCTGTQAAVAGATVLSSTFNLKSTANTVVRKDRSSGLITTVPGRFLKKGDRLAVNFGGVFTALTGLCITIVLAPILRRESW